MVSCRGAAAALLVLACSSASEQRAASAPKPGSASRVEALLAQMTLEEKAGQLTQWGAQVTPTGPLVRQGGEDDIRQGRVGSILGAYGVEGTRRLQELGTSFRVPVQIRQGNQGLQGCPAYFCVSVPRRLDQGVR